MISFVDSCLCPGLAMLGLRKRVVSFIFSCLCRGCLMVGKRERKEGEEKKKETEGRRRIEKEGGVIGNISKTRKNI